MSFVMLGLVAYTCIAVAAAAVTLLEHRGNPDRRLVDLGAGLAACMIWPALIVAVLWELSRRPA